MSSQLALAVALCPSRARGVPRVLCHRTESTCAGVPQLCTSASSCRCAIWSGAIICAQATCIDANASKTTPQYPCWIPSSPLPPACWASFGITPRSKQKLPPKSHACTLTIPETSLSKFGTHAEFIAVDKVSLSQEPAWRVPLAMPATLAQPFSCHLPSLDATCQLI